MVRLPRNDVSAVWTEERLRWLYDMETQAEGEMLNMISFLAARADSIVTAPELTERLFGEYERPGKMLAAALATLTKHAKKAGISGDKKIWPFMGFQWHGHAAYRMSRQIADIISQIDPAFDTIATEVAGAGATVTVTSYPDELTPGRTYWEGMIRRIRVNAYERSFAARKECIEYYGINCSVCGLNFEELYGEIGKGFIHVHHLTSLATIGEEYELDALKDLRPVCPNCHAMLHQKTPPFTIDELREHLR